MDDPTDPADATFQRLLNREILLSERRRMLILAALLAFILALILLATTFAPGFVRSIYHDRLPVHEALAAFSAFIAYELFAAGLLTIFIRRGRNFPILGRYMNALIETSFPTVLLYLLVGYLSAPVVFGTWPALLYFLFIILSTLRLDFALSAFTGAVAAVELFVLASVTLHLAWQTDDTNFNIGYHLTRSAVLLAAGLLAGAVGATIKSHFRRALAAASARDEVTNLFGQHVSPQVVERLLAIGAAELSEMRRVCIMFVDIRSFTAAARTRTPAEVVARLDAVFEILVDIVDRHNGIVNKFLGDGFLAIFGAPIDDPLEFCERRQGGARDAERYGGEQRRPSLADPPRHWNPRRSSGSRDRRLATPQGIYGHRRHGEPGLAPREPQQGGGFAAHHLRRRARSGGRGRGRCSPSWACPRARIRRGGHGVAPCLGSKLDQILGFDPIARISAANIRTA